MEARLTGRQERFCAEYASDLKRNQTQAAIRAGYSERSARIQASENMKNPNIRERIKELEREALEEAGYSAEGLRPMIMRRLVALAMTDAADVSQVIYANDARRKEALEQMAGANGGQGIIDFGEPLIYVKPTDEWTPEERAAVKTIKAGKYGPEIETCDKHASLRLLAEIAGITKAGVDVSLSITDELLEARARMAGGIAGNDG